MNLYQYIYQALGQTDGPRAYLRENGAIIVEGKMVCRLVYATPALAEDVRRAVELHYRGSSDD